MRRVCFLIVISLACSQNLFAYEGINPPVSKADDSAEWVSQLYKSSGYTNSSNSSENQGSRSQIVPTEAMQAVAQMIGQAPPALDETVTDRQTKVSAYSYSGENTVQSQPTQAVSSAVDQSVSQMLQDLPAHRYEPASDHSAPSLNMEAGSPNPQPKISSDKNNLETVDLEPQAEEANAAPGKSRVKISGHYRVAAGTDFESFIVNDSNPDLADWNYHYLFGERLNNTYDRAIYNQYRLNVDFTPMDKTNIHTQIVADPWSYVGTTGDQVQKSDIGGEEIMYNLKYFGANNSTIAEAFRTNVGDQVGFPVLKLHDGHTPLTTVHGFYDFNPATAGIPFTIPELDMDYEFRPFRKLWADYNEDDWHARVFALADQSQVLTTDDPLELSNHKDYWQQSPWLYQYMPIQFFSDGSIQRGYYSDFLSFYARDSEGNRLVLLKGASFEAALGKTYVASTIAAPYTPWDQKYFAADNIPGAVRLKHQATDKLMVGGTYTFRTGFVDNNIADFGQVVGVDARYKINEHVTAKSEIAGSHRELDVDTDDRLRASTQGYAYKAQVDTSFDHRMDGHTDASLSFTQMDQNFEPSLSRYSNTRDDHDWGKHIQFKGYSPELEYYRIGDGVDVDRYAFRFNWKEHLLEDTFSNLFDVRDVYRARDGAYQETVLREEATYELDPRTTVKGLFRWQGLPSTTAGVEPFIPNYYFTGLADPSNARYQNIDVVAGEDPSRFTYSGGAQYVFNPQWACEGIYEFSNDIPDFPRALLNGDFRDANDRIDGLLFDHLTNFLYGQSALGGAPPYHYFNIFRERVIYRPDDKIAFILHAAQNTYRFAASLDDNVNHEGLSVYYDYSKKISFFTDLTHSQLINLPKFLATNFTEKDYEGHVNFYTSMDYHINSSTIFRAEYGVFGLGLYSPQTNPYSAVGFSLPTIDTEHVFRVSLNGDF